MTTHIAFTFYTSRPDHVHSRVRSHIGYDDPARIGNALPEEAAGNGVTMPNRRSHQLSCRIFPFTMLIVVGWTPAAAEQLQRALGRKRGHVVIYAGIS